LPPGKNLLALWSLDFAAMHHETMISWHIPSQGALALVLNLLIANVPQFLLSLIYMSTNAILLLSFEWPGGFKQCDWSTHLKQSRKTPTIFSISLLNIYLCFTTDSGICSFALASFVEHLPRQHRRIQWQDNDTLRNFHVWTEAESCRE
jgi:hypothetical protein